MVWRVGGEGARCRVGIISDTHGRLDERVERVFAGVDVIVHAGDIGTGLIIETLETIAPVIAVRGNNDHAHCIHAQLPDLAEFEIAGVRGAVLHVKGQVPADVVERSAVVISGHTHRPVALMQDGVLWLNPGSVSQPRAAECGRTVALLDLHIGDAPSARIVSLDEVGS